MAGKKCVPSFIFVFFFFLAFCDPRLKKQLSEMQSTSESAILQSIEVNSTRQQQAIQQVNVKLQMLYMIFDVESVTSKTTLAQFCSNLKDLKACKVPEDELLSMFNIQILGVVLLFFITGHLQITFGLFFKASPGVLPFL